MEAAPLLVLSHSPKLLEVKEIEFHRFIINLQFLKKNFHRAYFDDKLSKAIIFENEIPKVYAFKSEKNDDSS